MEPAWNAGAGKPVEGSNPSVSAIFPEYFQEKDDGRAQ